MILLQEKKKIAAAVVLVLAMLLCGCTEKVEFENVKLPVDTESVTMTIKAGETALLDAMPQLKYADLSGSDCYQEIADWAAAHPEVEVKYTVSFPEGSVADNGTKVLDLSSLAEADVEKAIALMAYLPELEELKLMPGEFSPGSVQKFLEAVDGLKLEYSYSMGGMEVDHYAKELDLSALEPAALDEALALLPLLPELERVELGREGETKLGWDGIYALTQACPALDFDYEFTVYGKSFSLDDTVMDFNHMPISDNGLAAVQAARCMRELEVLDMDFCGIPNEGMEQIRAALPGVQVVWRIWFGTAYSVRTDVEKILASMPSRGGFVGDKDAQQLRYCTELKYLDLGHNEFITDISFVEYMPKLEVLVLAMNKITDISPLAACTELEYLEIQTNEALGDLSPLANCKKLAHLNVARCRNVEDISPLFGLTELERFWLGSGSKVPPEQVEEFKALHPDCAVNTTVFNDPTSEKWRITGMDPYTNEMFLDERYELLCEQFGYLTYDYSFSWKDPKYEAGWEDRQ